MKRIRTNWAAICIVCCIALNIKVCEVWASTGAPTSSLLMGIVVYTLGTLGVWYIVDQAIQDFKQRADEDKKLH